MAKARPLRRFLAHPGGQVHENVIREPLELVGLDSLRQGRRLGASG